MVLLGGPDARRGRRPTEQRRADTLPDRLREGPRALGAAAQVTHDQRRALAEHGDRRAIAVRASPPRVPAARRRWPSPAPVRRRSTSARSRRPDPRERSARVRRLRSGRARSRAARRRAADRTSAGRHRGRTARSRAGSPKQSVSAPKKRAPGARSTRVSSSTDGAVVDDRLLRQPLQRPAGLDGQRVRLRARPGRSCGRPFRRPAWSPACAPPGRRARSSRSSSPPTRPPGGCRR